MKINRVGLRKLISDYKQISKVPMDILILVEVEALIDELTDKEKNEFADAVTNYWHQKGFPYESVSESEIEDVYKKLCKHDGLSVLTGKKHNEVGQNIVGIGVVNSFHKERWEVQCRNFRTPMSNFKDKEILKKCILKCTKLNHWGNPVDESALRAILRVYSGTQIASNFRPTAAKYFYTKYAPIGGKVLDPSMGWGGRMFAALCSNNIAEYHCCDPAKSTVENNKRLLKIVQKIANKNSKLSTFFDDGERNNNLPKVIIHNMPFEEYDYKEGYFDLVFTSPPYFSIEKYTQEENQSWKRYSEYQDWINGFMKPLVKISHKVLKKGGYLILNIDGSVGTGINKRNLGEDTKKCMEEVFGKIYKLEFLQLSKQIGTHYTGKEIHNNRVDHKTERCFVFKKEI